VSCRTGPLRVGRSLRDLYTFLAPPFGRLYGRCLVVAAEAVDETAVALGRAFRWCSEVERAEEFALFGDFAAELFAGFCLAVESLGDDRGAALMAEKENLDVELAAFVFNVEHIADADLAGGLRGLVVGGDAIHVAGFGGLLAGFEEAGGP
jgi:hypothetical protein